MQMHKSGSICNMIGVLKVGRLHPLLHGYESSVAIDVLGQQLLQLLSKTLLPDEGPASQNMEVSYS